jgi:GDP/GTP exchange factor required for growth at low temperature
MQLEQSPSSPEARQGQTRRKSYGPSVRAERNTSRKGRMSMHTLFPTTIFPSATVRSNEATTSMRPLPLRKLRKARSNPQISADPIPPQPPPARGHSQSVTAADLPRLSMYSPPSGPVPALYPQPLIRDGFADVMRWGVESGPSSPISSRSHSHSHDSEASPSTGPFNPFGSGVLFDSPTPARTPEGYLHVPPLREMQSFESGMTARADPPLRVAIPSSLPPISSVGVDASPLADEAPSLPPGLGSSSDQDTSSVLLVSEEQDDVELLPSSPICSPLPSSPQANIPDPTYRLTYETMVHTRYSTEVFDVLQTYRGLPVLERLLEDSETAVIKMTLTTDDSAAPRNDPRFVIWGTVTLESQADDSLASRRSSGEFVHLVATNGSERERVLVAGTIERWLAQLTSALDYDELLVFFLTYRSYITALDLCHLLICRFHWALERSADGGDDMVRRIVRVRTFVAIRYWLLTFFAVDFVPNRELRLVLASWLNTLRRDPILQKHTDAMVRHRGPISALPCSDDRCDVEYRT